MNRHSMRRLSAGLAAAGLAIATLAGCTGTSSPSSSDASGDAITITWWHNATSDPLKGLYEDIAAEFEQAHPGVTVEVTGYQNEDLQRTLIPNALTSGDAPDVFQVWPGGEVRAQAAAGHLKDLSGLTDTIDALGATVNPWKYEGKQYGLPFTFGATGIWYNKDQYADAGITTLPSTYDELKDAVGKLKAAGYTPFAVGAGDGWPAGHWWYQFAIGACGQDVLQTAIPALDFSDPCWLEAGDQLEDFLATEPFNDGFLATPAQTGADSSAGLVANGNAASEFMGPWDAGVIGSLTPDQTVPEWLGWYPFPSTGSDAVVMGGGDGWGVYKDAPDEAVELVEYLLSEDVQKRFAASGAGVPTNPAAAAELTDANLKASSDALAAADYVQLWLDSDLGPAFGNPLNNAIVALFGGAGTPADIVTALEDTAAAQ